MIHTKHMLDKTMYTRLRCRIDISKNHERSCCHVNHPRIYREIVHEHTHAYTPVIYAFPCRLSEMYEIEGK